jgi:hypothetical protein
MALLTGLPVSGQTPIKALSVAAAAAALALVCDGVCLADQPGVAVETAVGAHSIAVGDTFRLNLKLEWGDGITVKPVAVPGKIGQFVVKDIDQGVVSAVGGRSARTSSLLLTTFETGSQTVPPVTIVYTGADGSSGKVESRPVEIEVASVLPDQVDDIRDIKRPISVPRRWRDIILSYALIVGLAGAAAASVLVSFKRREELEALARKIWLRVSRPVWRLILRLLALLGLARGRRGPVFDIEAREPGLLPVEAALKELDRIDALGLAGRGLVREHYTLVSEVVRRYVERQCAVLAMESPTSHTLGALRGRGLDAEVVAVIGDLLGECDLVKFAKHVPSEEAARTATGRARNIVKLTADFAPVGDAWFLSQRFAGVEMRGETSRPGGTPDRAEGGDER